MCILPLIFLGHQCLQLSPKCRFLKSLSFQIQPRLDVIQNKNCLPDNVHEKEASRLCVSWEHFGDVDDVGVDIDVGDVDDDEKEASWLPS